MVEDILTDIERRGVARLDHVNLLFRVVVVLLHLLERAQSPLILPRNLLLQKVRNIISLSILDTALFTSENLVQIMIV